MQNLHIFHYASSQRREYDWFFLKYGVFLKHIKLSLPVRCRHGHLVVGVVIAVRMEIVEELARLHVAIAVDVLAAAEPEDGVVEDVYGTMRRERETRDKSNTHRP